MIYLTGMYALNTPCSLNTTGDWHRCCFDWTHPEYAESTGSIWGDYGIERNASIPMLGITGNKANHIRAILDLLAQSRFSEAQGMADDFICTNEYDLDIFNQVLKLRSAANWAKVCSFMYHEYQGEWRKFLESKGVPLIMNAKFRLGDN